MQRYNNLYYLQHAGVLGMRWGIRNSSNENESNAKNKLHLGLDKRGNINLIRGKTNKEAKTVFAVKTIMFIASITATMYISKHPKSVMTGQTKAKNILNSIGNKSIKEVGPTMSGIFSKTLGRELTFMEAFESGFDMSD